LEVVYNTPYSLGITDFTSCLAAIEASGAEILVPWILIGDVQFVKEWYDRQSPCVVWGRLETAQDNAFWGLTEGKCDTISSAGLPAVAGYQLTNKTMSFRQAYIQRWGEVPNAMAVASYDSLRFILTDAIKRAGTTETQAVIKALETTDVETTSARHFIFTSSHDIMVELESPTNPSQDYFLMCYFQWQNGTQVPVYPEAITKEAGATYKYPPWEGPWSK
jgi:branched-chain amino acid transport system substrate-binding protein